jgi:hypothetical protein
LPIAGALLLSRLTREPLLPIAPMKLPIRFGLIGFPSVYLEGWDNII